MFPQSTVDEANTGHSGVFHLHVGVVKVVPIPEQLRYRSHEPLKEIDLVGSLRQHDAAALGGPLPSPRVQLVVLTVTPPEHHQHAEDGTADFARIDRLLDPLHRFVEASLADDPEFDVGRVRRSDHGVAPLQVDSHRLLNQHMPAARSAGDGEFRVRWMRRADGRGLNSRVSEKIRQIAVGLATKPGGEGSRALRQRIEHGDQTRGG